MMFGEPSEIADIAERVRFNIERHCSPQNTPRLRRQITASIGAAMCDADTASLADLIQRADEQMYRAKTAGKNQVCLLRHEPKPAQAA